VVKKYVLSVLVLLFTTAVSANDKKSFLFYVGQQNGGVGAIFQTVLAEELERRGWKIDFKIIGNCGQVKNTMTTTNKPMLSGWSGHWNGSADNVCYNLPTTENFGGTFVITPRLLCGPQDTEFSLKKGQTYRVGVNQGQHHDLFLNALGQKLGVTFKAIEYSNSGTIKRAIQGKEIDAWYTTAGLNDHIAGKRQCVLGTFNKTTNGIVPLNTILKTKNVNSAFVGYLITNNKFDPVVRQQLMKDIDQIIKSSDYQTRLQSTGSFVDNSNLKEQIEFIKENSKAFEK
jgi:hypothetical protein